MKQLIPNYSLGLFKLNEDIRKYIEIPHVYKIYENDGFIYDSYNFQHLGVTIWVNNFRIDSINCDMECYWKGKNLIGLSFSDFKIDNDVEPDSVDEIYLLVNGKGQNQDVYDFNSLGLQIWVWRKKIVSVTISNYNES